MLPVGTGLEQGERTGGWFCYRSTRRRGLSHRPIRTVNSFYERKVVDILSSAALWAGNLSAVLFAGVDRFRGRSHDLDLSRACRTSRQWSRFALL